MVSPVVVVGQQSGETLEIEGAFQRANQNPATVQPDRQINK